jgi:hypothetical protein
MFATLLPDARIGRWLGTLALATVLVTISLPLTAAARDDAGGSKPGTAASSDGLSPGEIDLILPILQRDLALLRQYPVLAEAQLADWLGAQAELVFRAIRNVAAETALTAAQRTLVDGLVKETIHPTRVPAPAVPDPESRPRPVVITTGALPGLPGRLRRQDVAVIYRLAQAELARLRQRMPQEPPEVEGRLNLFIEGQLATAAHIPGHDPGQLTAPEHALARSMTADVMAGRPASELTSQDSRLTAEVLKTLLADTRTRAQSLATAGGPAGPGNPRKPLVEFARQRAKELSGITGEWKPDELAEIDNIVDLSLLPEALKVPRPEIPDSAPGPEAKTPTLAPAFRDRLFHLLREICTKVFPLFGVQDAGVRRYNLVKFIEDNAQALGVDQADAEGLIGQFLAENPGALEPPPTAIPVAPPAPIIGVPPTAPTVVPFVLVPQSRPRGCLPLR